MTTETTAEAVQQTLAEYERIAIASGEQVRIDPPEFSAGAVPIIGTTWSPLWLSDEPPAAARATVYREGVPTTVYVSWAESLPAVDDWRALWERKPMKLFGAYTLRTALRRAFRDVIGERVEPDDTIDIPAASARPVNTDRDWIAELGEAQTTDAVHAIHRDAKAARAVTVELERTIRLRLRAVQEHGGVHVAAAPQPTPTTPREPEVTTPPAPTTRPRPVPAPPKVRLEDTVRRPKSGSRPQKQKPRVPRG